MGGAPAKRAPEAPPSPDPKEGQTVVKPDASSRAPAKPKPSPRKAKTPAAKKRTPKRKAPEPAVEAAPDGYVGKSQYQRKRRGLVSKVAVHLSPNVASALRRAGAVGDENGSNMSEIVEALLVRAGYVGDE
ncbi:hypothetical protein [Rubricoccus marinus]|uniref:Uncharacterized protein n=1 Tax=Rubricoccus marinus TaxID=716817 RepID=A0A259TUA0_9BACT|nr:hypothetical protein [Rubricoccus marinus]OZC01345.1 hypothetical protein BSZ36_18065 [Rubricoccus marinus]